MTDAIFKIDENISPGKEFLRITKDRQVIVATDIYEAARAFWDLVKQITPSGMGFEVAGYRERQEAQLATWQTWIREQGKNGRPPLELPVTLDTLLQPHQRLRLDWLKREVRGNVLEIGCSWGFTLAWVGGHAGVDLNPANVDLARLLAPDRFFAVADARDLRALPFPDGHFATVMCPEILEHLPWSTGVFQAIDWAVRLAKDRVLITLPAPDSEEAAGKKHAWIADDEHVAKIMAYLQGPGCNLMRHDTQVDGREFVCIKMEKPK